MGNDSIYPYYNEACAFCGVPADLHRSSDSPPETSPHTMWGWLTCRNFTRCDPPRPAYGTAWWLEMKKYDSTVARIAGNIASGVVAKALVSKKEVSEETLARDCVSLARAIVAEVERTEPKEPQ